MKVLITNDDGFYAGGIRALASVASKHAEVFMVAPRYEQSGISQAITFLRPLFPHVLKGDIQGYSIDGTPVDCVKLALHQLCPFKPDVVLSGINGGLNAGVNVCHSGTVGGALAAATFGLRSIAASLEFGKDMDYDAAAELIWPIVERLIDQPHRPGVTHNINVPSTALEQDHDTLVVPFETNPLGYDFDHGADPKQRPYFWANNGPDPKQSPMPTDCSELKKGNVTITPLSFDLNAREVLIEMQNSFSNESTT